MKYAKDVIVAHRENDPFDDDLLIADRDPTDKDHAKLSTYWWNNKERRGWTNLSLEDKGLWHSGYILQPRTNKDE